MDQSAGMLDDDVKEKGYALLCVSTPQTDCKIRTIEEVGPSRNRRLHRCINQSTNAIRICPEVCGGAGRSIRSCCVDSRWRRLCETAGPS